LYYEKLLKCRAVVRSCKNFLLRVVAGWCSCKKFRGNVVYITFIIRFTKMC
jgi:hypothetical protein